jgi:hypothetical protein
MAAAQSGGHAGDDQAKGEAMRRSRRARSPFSFLFVSSRREEYLAQYVLRECARGRSLEEVLTDRYVRNRSTAEERARLLERPEVVAELRDRAIADIRHSLADGGPAAAART